jgi:hypothetical protein
LFVCHILFVFCLTSQVSRDHTWRGLCVSTDRDMYGRWLYCLVRRLGFIYIWAHI